MTVYFKYIAVTIDDLNDKFESLPDKALTHKIEEIIKIHDQAIT